MADSYDESELSGDEIIENISDFELVKINKEEREHIQQEWCDIVGDSDNDEEF